MIEFDDDVASLRKKHSALHGGKDSITFWNFRSEMSADGRDLYDATRVLTSSCGGNLTVSHGNDLISKLKRDSQIVVSGGRHFRRFPTLVYNPPHFTLFSTPIPLCRSDSREALE